MSRDVNELWAQLKAAQAPAVSASRRGPSLSGLAGLPGITTSVRKYDKSRGPQAPPQRPSFIAQLGQRGQDDQQQNQQQGAAGDHQALLVSWGLPLPPARQVDRRRQFATWQPSEVYQSILCVQASLQRDINGLSDPDRATRRRSVSISASQQHVTWPLTAASTS